MLKFGALEQRCFNLKVHLIATVERCLEDTMMKWLHAEQGSMFGMWANDGELLIFIVMPYLIIPVLPGVLGATLWHQSSRLIPFDMSGIIFHPAMPELVKGTVYRTSYLMDSMQLPVGCSLVFPSI